MTTAWTYPVEHVGRKLITDMFWFSLVYGKLKHTSLNGANYGSSGSNWIHVVSTMNVLNLVKDTSYMYMHASVTHQILTPRYKLTRSSIFHIPTSCRVRHQWNSNMHLHVCRVSYRNFGRGGDRARSESRGVVLPPDAKCYMHCCLTILSP